MAGERVQRRLAAILAADVVGYSRLMGEDEAGTLAALKGLRAAAIDPAISGHRGRIVKLMGDGALVEFASVVDAVDCAVAIQRDLAARNAGVADGTRIEFRIGINLGDVIIDGDDVYGDGVNVAARLEGLAEPGGICVSEKVYAEVGNKIDVGFEDLGPKQVKNIAAPVRVYRVSPDRERTPSDATPQSAATPTSEKLPLPDIPSIAVLPFNNMSGDPEQEYFADGIMEDLTTDLSKISGLFVVARNSASLYKGQAVDIRAVGAKLGVRYVLEGSVRKSGNRVRINAQLIEAETGGHLWAERYDGSVDDVFELQDEVCAKVVEALSVQLTAKEADNLKTVHTDNLEAYELYVRARTTPYPPVPDRIESARKMFRRVIELDPAFAGGYAGVSVMMSFNGIWSHADETEATKMALDLAHKAISVDPAYGWSYTALGLALMHFHRYGEAIAAAREAIARQPNDADAHSFLGLILGLDGQYDAGVDAINQALRLNPLFFNGPYLNMRGQTHLLAGNFGAAVDTFRENIARTGPVGPPAISWAAAAYFGQGNEDEARRLTDRLRSDFPGFTLTNWNYPSLIRDEDVRARVIRLMRDAGVPG